MQKYPGELTPDRACLAKVQFCVAKHGDNNALYKYKNIQPVICSLSRHCSRDMSFNIKLYAYSVFRISTIRRLFW